ncbi:sugar-specific transcriptional regulator TrmB [Kitasatospora sp. GP30]|uniref:LuxR C-terminal-related transcriptional regulator n=1 Tax=Kitasatospora sp. GP30 TaxID=3035084 RepID=UPI000CC995F5|nr:LuxR C-terminal-related transcriptional regulator [Kitasatospora sp. GP30]MDH6141982.1 sugar-specific transcriptional regulator TrmB [Kitasatospora sp. GP30]
MADLTPVVDEESQRLYVRIATEGYRPTDADARAVSHLLNLGLLRSAPDGPVPVDPSYVAARWQADFHDRAADHHAEAALMLRHSAGVSDALRPLIYAYGNRQVDSTLIEVLRGSDAIGARLTQVLASATEEVLSAQPGAVRRPEAMDEATPRDTDALRRGVTMRTLYNDQVRLIENMDRRVALMTDAGAEYRTLGEKFQRFFVIDRKIAVIPGNTVMVTSNEALAHMVHDPVLAGFLAGQFERDWSRADPWRGAEDDPLSVREKNIMRLLAAGGSQQSIARELNLAKRTVAEAVAGLKERYEAATPFQLAHNWHEAMRHEQELRGSAR